MRTLLSRAIQVDPTFHIGLSLIVILAIVEIFAATSYYDFAGGGPPQSFSVAC